MFSNCWYIACCQNIDNNQEIQALDSAEYKTKFLQDKLCLLHKQVAQTKLAKWQ